MPCSCQKNKIKNNQDKQTAAIAITSQNKAQPRVVPSYTATIAPAAAMYVPQNKQGSDSSSYDFTPTTQTMDTCAYCAMKHIALASSLLDLKDNFSAAGELQLASYHYNIANQSMSQRCRDMAKLLIINPKEAIDKLPQLLKQAMKYPAQGDTKQTNPGKLNYDPVMSTVHTAAAQALMYTQIFYQTLNQAYAVGELIIAAVNIQLHHRDIARNLRRAWKVIQQIKEPNDKAYKDAQQIILQCKAQLQKVLMDQALIYVQKPADDAGTKQVPVVKAQIVDNNQGTNAVPVN